MHWLPLFALNLGALVPISAGMSDLEAAHRHVKAGRYEDAERAFSAAVGTPSTRIQGLGCRAYFYKCCGRYEEALADYDVLVSLNPEDYEAQALRADTIRLLGDISAALQVILPVISRAPLNSTATRVLLSCQEALGASEPSTPVHGEAAMWKPANRIIELLEEEPTAFPTSVFPPIGRFLYALVRCVRPRLALETGCYIGYSTLCIAQALEDNRMGHLHSFDLFCDLEGFVSPVVGRCADAHLVACSHIEKAGLSERVTFHKGDSPTAIRALTAANDVTFDFAFIDGDHTAQGCLGDWRALDERLAEGGIVAVHDTNPEKCRWLGPRSLLEGLTRNASAGYHWLNVPTPEGFGVGLIQKRSKARAAAWYPSLPGLLAEYLYLRKYWPPQVRRLKDVFRRRP
jgi:predicted O-methyltransferase YrrM